MAFDPLSLGLSVVGGLFGSNRPRYDPSQKLQMDVARQLQQYAAGVPGSDPGEMAALAEMRARLGQQQAGQRNQLLAAMPQFAQGATGDMLTNLGVQQQGAMMSLDLAHMADAMNRRKQALLDSASVARGVGPQQREPNGVAQGLAGLAYQLGQSKANKRPRAQGTQDDGTAGTGALTLPGTAEGENPFIPEGIRPPSYPTAGGTFLAGADTTVRMPGAQSAGGVGTPMLASGDQRSGLANFFADILQNRRKLPPVSQNTMELLGPQPNWMADPVNYRVKGWGR